MKGISTKGTLISALPHLILFMQKPEQADQTKCSVVTQLVSASGISECQRAVTGTRATVLALSERKMTAIGTGRSVPGLHFSFTQLYEAGVKRSSCHNRESVFVHKAGECTKHMCSLQDLQVLQVDVLRTCNGVTYSFGLGGFPGCLFPLWINHRRFCHMPISKKQF